MEHTPQSLRSSLSPYQHQGRRLTFAYNPSYPTPPRTESTSLQHTPNHGLGLYGCSITPSSAHPGGKGLPTSPHPSELWGHTSIVDQDLSQSSQPADLFSEAYDPFSTLHSTSASTCLPSTFTSAPRDPPSLTRSPGLSSHNRHSHRSSISSSCAPSDVYSHAGSDVAFTPKVKMEDSQDWFASANNGDPLLARTLSGHDLSATAQGPPTPYSRPYYLFETHDGSWERTERHSDPMRYLAERDRNERLSSPDTRRSTSDNDQRTVTSVTRTKKKRQRTTPEDANHECRICGQLFRRSYNWKSHMDIHNPVRKYPHPCLEPDCPKKFTRKTDLDRHHESVRVLWICDWRDLLTGSGTLEEEKLPMRIMWEQICAQRHAQEVCLMAFSPCYFQAYESCRHGEDGCPKRFEFNSRTTLDSPASLRPRTPTREMPYRNRPFSIEASHTPAMPSPTVSSYPSTSHDTFPTSSDYPSNTTGYFY